MTADQKATEVRKKWWRGDPHRALSWDDAKALDRCIADGMMELVEAAELGLSFAPVGEVPPGLDATFYYTGHFESDLKVQTRIEKARKLVRAYRGE